MASPSPLLNLHVAAPIDGGFKSLNSKPPAQWLSETNRVLWKFTELSQHSESNGVGSLKARVELERGPGNQGTIFTQFNCEGTTLSGVEFELIGSGYRLSLVKRKFVSGELIEQLDKLFVKILILINYKLIYSQSVFFKMKHCNVK